jgi:hypothetical protein
MSLPWLDHLIVKSATELELARKTVFQFGRAVTQAMAKNPVQDWEAAAWTRGLKTGLIRLEGYFFRVGSGKRSPLSFFVRNDQDLYVGLRRESITQAATYVSLVTDYGYSRSQTRFESQWMDVAVYGPEGRAWIYAENKAGQKTLEELCARLATEFQTDVPKIDPEANIFDDALMKAQHIWRHRPRYFWGVCPTISKPYLLHYGRNGFELDALSDLPGMWELDL